MLWGDQWMANMDMSRKKRTTSYADMTNYDFEKYDAAYNNAAATVVGADVAVDDSKKDEDWIGKYENMADYLADKNKMDGYYDKYYNEATENPSDDMKYDDDKKEEKDDDKNDDDDDFDM